jgi:hypothetical protein
LALFAEGITMKTPDIQEKKQTGAVPGPPQRLPLGSLPNARRSLTRLMISFYKGEMEASKFKTILYGFNVLLGFLKEEQLDQIEKRIKALEDAAKINTKGEVK